MRIRLITITHKTPSWVKQGYEEYAKRLSSACVLELVEIPAIKRPANADLNRIMQQEGKKMLGLIKPNHYVIALDVKGKLWSSEELAHQLSRWFQVGNNIDLLIGGPEGLAPQCLQIAKERWSLSPLTFPHILVRLIVVEQIYRATTIIQGHPYHK